MEVILRRLKKPEQSDLWVQTDEVYDFTAQRSYTIGRKKNNDIQLYSKAVSRQHCIFHHRTDGLFVEGLNSPSNMLINSLCPEKNVLVKLNNGDIIKIGYMYTCRVEIKLRQPETLNLPTASVSIKSESAVPDLNDSEANGETSSATSSNLPHIPLSSTTGVKRELDEDLIDPPPNKAARFTTGETCSEALARVSMKGEAQTQSSVQPTVESDLNSLALDFSSESSPIITFEMQFKIEDQDTKPLDLQCEILNPNLPIESLAQNVNPESELNPNEIIKVENPDIPVTNKTLFAKETPEVLPGPSHVDDSPNEEPQHTDPEQEAIPFVKVENPDIPSTNKTLFAKETPEVFPGPSHVDDPPNEEPQHTDPEQEAIPFVKVENPDIPSTNKTLFAKETPEVLPDPSHVDDPPNEEPQHTDPEQEAIPLVKVENPDIPSTNKTLFAKETPEVLPGPSHVDPPNEELQNTVSDKEAISDFNQDFSQNLELPSRSQTSDFDKEMQIEIEEPDLKPVLSSETHFDVASNSTRENETERNDSTSGEVRDKNYLDSIESRINSYLAIRVKSEFQNFGETSESQLNPLLDENNLLIRDQNDSLVELPTETHIQTAIEAQVRVKSEPQKESDSVEHPSQIQSSLEAQVSSDLGIQVKSEERNTGELPELEIIQVNPTEDNLVSREHQEIDTPFDSSVEVAIIGEYWKRKRRSRRERDSEGTNIGVRIKEEPQMDEIDINVSIKQEKGSDAHPSIQNSSLLVKEERSDPVIERPLENQLHPNQSLPNEPTVKSERLDSIVNCPGTLVDSIEFNEEKPASVKEILNKSLEDNSKSLAEKRIDASNTDSLLSDSLRIKNEHLQESLNSDRSDDNSVDSDCTTDTESTWTMIKEVVEAENVPEVRPIRGDDASTSSNGNRNRSSRTTENSELEESVMEINKYLNEFFETTPSLEKPDNENRKRRKELNRTKVVVSKEVQNVESKKSVKKKDRSKERDKKEREDEKAKQRDEERDKQRDKKSKESKSKDTTEIRSKDTEKEKEKKSRKEDKSRKREEMKEQGKSEDSSKRKGHEEESSSKSKVEKQKETHKVDSNSKRPEPGNSRLEKRAESKDSTDDSEIRGHVGANVLGVEDFVEERRRPVDRLHYQSRFTGPGRGFREPGDKGTGPGPKKKVINIAEYKSRSAKSGAGSVPGTRAQQGESQMDAASAMPLPYSLPLSSRSVEDNQYRTFRNLGMNQPPFANPNFADPRRPADSHNIPFVNTGIPQGQVQSSWSDVQISGMENDPRIQQMNRSLHQDQSNSSRGLENEVRGSVFQDPRNQLRTETIGNIRSSPKKNLNSRGLEREVPGSSSSDPRKQPSSRGLESGPSSLDPRLQGSTKPKDPRDTNFSFRGMGVEVAGPSSSDPRTKVNPRQPHSRNSGRDEVAGAKEMEKKLRSSLHVDPRVDRELEFDPQHSTGGSEPQGPGESSDLADHLLYEIFTWSPNVFLNTSMRKSFLRSLQNIDPMLTTYESYSHYQKIIFEILCLDIASKIKLEIMIDQESSKFEQCVVLPELIEKVRLKQANDPNSYLRPFYLRISVPILDVPIPHAGDLLEIYVISEDKTFLVFGCIQKITFRGPSDGPRKLINYLVTIKDDARFDICECKIKRVRIIKNLSWEIKCANALLNLEDSPLLPHILQPAKHISTQRPRNLLRSKDLVVPVNLDEDQIEAISMIIQAVASPEPRVCLIEGSIGTGKTDLIFHSILKLLWKPNCKAGKEQEENKTNILVCTSSNVEFEEIVTKLIAMDPASNGINMVVVTNDEDNASARIEKFTLQHFVTSYIEKQKAKYHQTQGRKDLKLQAQIYKNGMEKLADEFKLTKCKFTGLKMKVFKAFFDAASNNKTVKDLSAHDLVDLFETGNLTYLLGANLIFCNIANLTNHPAMEQYRKHKTITLCIMDEATQISELETLKVFGFGAKTLVQLGNKEKKPTNKFSEELWKFRAGSSLFSRLTRNFLNSERSPVVHLRTQHRFTKDLEQWLKRGGFIKLLTSFNAVELAVPFPIYSLRIFNLKFTEDFVEDEACFTSRVIQCIASFGDLRRMERKISVGVIISNICSKERVEQEIQNRLDLVPERKAQILNVETNTVDAFANREKDIILTSCLRNRELLSDEGFQQFYSGLTRAKYCVIIFGRFTKVSKVRRECGWHSLVDLYARDAVHISVHTEYTEFRRDLIR